MQRIKVDKVIRFAKKNFNYKKFALCIGDSRQVIQVLKQVTGSPCQSKQLSSLEVDGFEVYDYTEIASVLNHHFVSVGRKLEVSSSEETTGNRPSGVYPDMLKNAKVIPLYK